MSCIVCQAAPAFDMGEFSLCRLHYKVAEAHFRWRVHAGHPVVYFADARNQAADDWRGGLVKIGTTHNLEARMRSLRCRSIATQPGDLITERTYHEAFTASRVRGDWFRPTQDIVRLMRALDRRGVNDWVRFAS